MRIFILSIFFFLPLLLKASLVFNETIIEDEASKRQAQYEFCFKFKNTGKSPVRILSLKSSCSCTVANLEKDIYQPGDFGEIKGIFNIGNRQGLQEQEIAIQTDNISQSQIKLGVKIKILEDYKINTRLLYWERSENAVIKKIILNINNNDWKLHNIKYNADNFAIKAEKGANCYIINAIPVSTEAPIHDLIKLELKNGNNEIETLALHALIK